MRVIVSGGASGLGAAVVAAVRAEGGSPFVVDVHEPSTDVPFALADVSRAEQVETAVDEAAAVLGGVDGIVTAAGIDRCGSMLEVPAADWERVIGVNLIGTAALIRAALPRLLESSGRIITVASTLGLRPAGDASAYCASKAGVVGLTRALALELRGRVGVTLLIPGGMRTSFFDGRDAQYQPPADAQLCDPGDVARAVLMALASPPGCELRELVVAPPTEPSWP